MLIEKVYGEKVYASEMLSTLPNQEKKEFMEILDNKDGVSMEFFLRHHWKQIS